jgi:hypothetical protein
MAVLFVHPAKLHTNVGTTPEWPVRELGIQATAPGEQIRSDGINGLLRVEMDASCARAE